MPIENSSAEEVRSEEGNSEAASEPARPDRDGLSASLLEEALSIVRTIAKNGDPYSEDPARRYKPESHPDTVKALCIVAAMLADQRDPRDHAFAPTGTVEGRGPSSLDDYMQDIERREIVQALEAAKHNKTAAARILGITFRALRYKLTQLGID
jgi:DNA-binding NtrC family response regulator